MKQEPRVGGGPSPPPHFCRYVVSPDNGAPQLHLLALGNYSESLESCLRFV